MHPILLTYLLGVLIIALGLGFVNRKTKYITSYDFENDSSIIIFLFCIVTVLWPLALVVGIIAGILYGYYRAFVPKD